MEFKLFKKFLSFVLPLSLLTLCDKIKEIFSFGYEEEDEEIIDNEEQKEEQENEEQEEKVVDCLVTWMNGKSKITTTKVKKGSAATLDINKYEAQLIKNGDPDKYTFIVWNTKRQDNDVGNALTSAVIAGNKNIEMFAVHKAITRYYTITFENDDDTLISTQEFPYNSKVTQPSTLKGVSDDLFSYGSSLDEEYRKENLVIKYNGTKTQFDKLEPQYWLNCKQVQCSDGIFSKW